MATLRIEGGRPLAGTVSPSGSKTAALAAVAAALLLPGTSVIENVPAIRDMAVMEAILRHLGVPHEPTGARWVIDGSRLGSWRVPPELAKHIRGGLLLLAPLLARFGRAEVGLPGGCVVGPRPIDLHVKGLTLLGAEIRVEHGAIVAEAPRGLAGREVYLDFPSVGATLQLLLAGVAARGCTVIHHAAKEPEVVDLAMFLARAGARITGAGTDQVRVEGGMPLQGVVHGLLPDRIEAGTYLLAGAATGGRVRVSGVIVEHLRAVLAKLAEAGVQVETEPGLVEVSAPGPLQALEVTALPYPGFPTDLHPPFAAVLTRAEGLSTIIDVVFANRFAYVEEFRRLGARVTVESGTVLIHGVPALQGAEVWAQDVRSAAALLIAGLAARGQTHLHGAEHLRRGYAEFESKWTALGARVTWED